MSIVVSDVTVAFGGVVALNKVSISVEPARILGVVGPNGSGKSTLFNAIMGLVRPKTGSISVDGATIDNLSAAARIMVGLARTFQTPRFDPAITVEEAVLCGFFPKSKTGLLGTLFSTPGAMREERVFRERAAEIMKDLRLWNFRHHKMSELPMGRVRLVEVARAVANDSRYILLDEPAAGLAKDEQVMLGEEIRRLAAAGLGVLLIEHNFGLVKNLAENVVVLKDGAMFMQGEIQEVGRNPAFIDMYLGNVGRTPQ